MSMQQIADVLIASWALAQEKRPLPTSRGVLDRALETVVNGGHFPEFFKTELHFVDTRLGKRCAELGEVLTWAQASEQTSDPNPSYLSTVPKAGQLAALSILYDLDIDAEKARQWGYALAAAIQQENSRLREFAASRG